MAAREARALTFWATALLGDGGTCVPRVCKGCGTGSGNTRVGRAAGAWRRSLPNSIRSSGGGLGTSNTRDSRRFAPSMALSVDASGRSCGSGTNVRALVGPRRIISAGRRLSLLLRGFSPFRKLMSGHANPDEETTDWRAVCGRTACTVRRAGRARALSDPYHLRLGGVTIWRIQCTTCRAVFTVLPHFVLRYRQMRPEVARDALLATHGGLIPNCVSQTDLHLAYQPWMRTSNQNKKVSS